jgi:adenine-specific DNA-methyltransferase
MGRPHAPVRLCAVKSSGEPASAPVAEATPESELERRLPREDRYRIGQFFTPPAIADFMATWIREAEPETVLDPGVGGGALLRAIGAGPRRFGLDINVDAVELSLESLGGEAEIAVGDFLDPEGWPLSEHSFDAVIANPPYIRHHNLTAEDKGRAARYKQELQAQVSRLSGSYVYFFLEALLRLNEGGRLAFITPTEFLDVRYGRAVKEVLMAQCQIDEILVLEMDELAFEKVLTTSAITIATKRTKPGKTVRLTEGHLNGSVGRARSVDLKTAVAAAELPWTPLLPARAERIAPLLKGRSAKLGDFCKVRRGIATGDNSFFCLSRENVEEHGIEERFLAPVVVGSRDLPLSGPLDDEFRQSRIEQGARAFLFYCHEPREALVGTNALRYIELGEEAGLHERFNSRARRPWYGVERVPPADFFVTYMSRQRARIIRNLTDARCMTSLLNLWAKPEVDAEDLRPVLEDPVNATLLRELGRTYGGGLGKIEPGELVALPIAPPLKAASPVTPPPWPNG